MHSSDNVRRAMQNAKRGCWSCNRYREKYKLIVTLIMVLANERVCFLTDPIGLLRCFNPYYRLDVFPLPRTQYSYLLGDSFHSTLNMWHFYL